MDILENKPEGWKIISGCDDLFFVSNPMILMAYLFVFAIESPNRLYVRGSSTGFNVEAITTWIFFIRINIK